MGLNNIRLHHLGLYGWNYQWVWGLLKYMWHFFLLFGQSKTQTWMYTLKCQQIFHFLANNHETTTYFGIGDKVIKACLCLSRTGCMQHSCHNCYVSWWQSWFFSCWWLISNLTQQGERYFTAVTIKRVFSSVHRQAPRAKQLAHHMITSWLLMAVGAIALSVNSTLEQSVGPVVYN